jgi:hypothetical protein
VVLAALVEGLHVLCQHDLAVDAQAHEAAAARVGQQLPVLALAVHQQRRHQHQALAGGGTGDLPRDLLGGLPLHRLAAGVAVLGADARVEHAQVVGDLGDGPHGRARVRTGGLLLDRDRGRQAANRVVVRLLHLAEELARVGGERLDVAALALGVQRVEGERRLPGAGDARQDHQLLLGDPHVDAAQVVLAGAADEDVVELHGGGRE